MLQKSLLVPALTLLVCSAVFADDQVLTAQRSLKRQGIYEGPADGEMNPGVHDGIQRFQQRNGIEPTGNLDRDTMYALNNVLKLAECFRGTLFEQSSYKTQREKLKRAQEILLNEELYNGDANGYLDQKTVKAIIRFQRSHHIGDSGRLDMHTLAAMGFVPRPERPDFSDRPDRPDRPERPPQRPDHPPRPDFPPRGPGGPDGPGGPGGWRP